MKPRTVLVIAPHGMAFKIRATELARETNAKVGAINRYLAMIDGTHYIFARSVHDIRGMQVDEVQVWGHAQARMDFEELHREALTRVRAPK